jgi:hypothetical protein
VASTIHPAFAESRRSGAPYPSNGVGQPRVPGRRSRRFPPYSGRVTIRYGTCNNRGVGCQTDQPGPADRSRG